jgi:polyhydroxyalkanoate synthase
MQDQNGLNTWVTDICLMTGGCYRQLIVDLYRNNRLMKGELEIPRELVNLKRLGANLLAVIAEGDHITPPGQSGAILSKVSNNDKQIFRVQEGHIGIMAESGAENDLAAH